MCRRFCRIDGKDEFTQDRKMVRHIDQCHMGIRIHPSCGRCGRCGCSVVFMTCPCNIKRMRFLKDNGLECRCSKWLLVRCYDAYIYKYIYLSIYLSIDMHAWLQVSSLISPQCLDTWHCMTFVHTIFTDTIYVVGSWYRCDIDRSMDTRLQEAIDLSLTLGERIDIILCLCPCYVQHTIFTDTYERHWYYI